MTTLPDTPPPAEAERSTPEKIEPFLRGKFGLYWTPDGNNVHLRVAVDGLPTFEQDMPFSAVQRFLHVESPAEMMAEIQQMAAQDQEQEAA